MKGVIFFCSWRGVFGGVVFGGDEEVVGVE